MIGPKTKITPGEVSLIHKLKKENKTLAEISAVVGYSTATIYRLLGNQYRYPDPISISSEN